MRRTNLPMRSRRHSPALGLGDVDAAAVRHRRPDRPGQASIALAPKPADKIVVHIRGGQVAAKIMIQLARTVVVAGPGNEQT